MLNTIYKKVSYKSANHTDTKEVQNLLMENQLPFEDLESSNVSLTFALLEGQIIGCIGVEKKGEDGLLRSFSVSQKHKNQGIGNELFNRLINRLKSENIKTLHLLTTTAESYFNKRGFLVSSRIHAPKSIMETTEFTSLCPSNSIYMTFDLNK
jgi:amino-acid N-acetyltransferase